MALCLPELIDDVVLQPLLGVVQLLELVAPHGPVLLHQRGCLVAWWLQGSSAVAMLLTLYTVGTSAGISSTSPLVLRRNRTRNNFE